MSSASKKNFLDIKFIFFKFLGLAKAFKPACVSPVLEFKKNKFNIKQIILPMKNRDI